MTGRISEDWRSGEYDIRFTRTAFSPFKRATPYVWSIWRGDVRLAFGSFTSRTEALRHINQELIRLGGNNGL